VQVPEQTPMLDDEEEKKSKQELGPEDETLIEIPTYNFTLLFCCLMIGSGAGYIVWIFVEKEMILWAGAALGLLIGRILEVTLFPQNVVQIWTPKSSVEMTEVPQWKEELQDTTDFYVQSDMYDIMHTNVVGTGKKRYVRTTAVYHYPNTNALTIQQRFVKRKSWFYGYLFFSSPIGGAVAFIIGLAASALWYLKNQQIDKNVSLFIICVVVLVPIIVLLGCLIEVELRKRRFFSNNIASEVVTNVPLHTVGKIERWTIGGDFWRMFYVPPEARSNWTRAKLALKLIFGPVLVVFRICVFVILMSKYNGAFGLFFWECIATVLLYQLQVQKEARFLEPTMALLWLTFLINLFEIWYCSPSNGRVDRISLLGTNGIRKLELDSETRLPKEKVRILWYCFCVSGILVLLSAILMTYATDAIMKEIVIYNFDDSWEDNYKANQKYIMCDLDDGSSGSGSGSTSNFTFNETRRLMAQEFHLAPSMLRASADIKTKYSSDYDALCAKNNYNSISIALVLCSIDWFLLIIMGVYWHTYDKYQTHMDYDDSLMLWHQYTYFIIHAVPSKITWLGRIIGRHLEQTTDFFIHEHDAEMLGNFLINNVPWYSHLPVNQAGAKELMPRLPDVDCDDSENSIMGELMGFLKKFEL